MLLSTFVKMVKRPFIIKKNFYINLHNFSKKMVVLLPKIREESCVFQTCYFSEIWLQSFGRKLRDFLKNCAKCYAWNEKSPQIVNSLNETVATLCRHCSLNFIFTRVNTGIKSAVLAIKSTSLYFPTFFPSCVNNYCIFSTSLKVWEKLNPSAWFCYDIIIVYGASIEKVKFLLVLPHETLSLFSYKPTHCIVKTFKCCLFVKASDKAVKRNICFLYLFL